MSWLRKIFTLRYPPNKIAWWSGGDAIKKVIMPPGSWLFKLRVLNNRLAWKIGHRFFNEHWVNHAPLANALIKFGIPESKIKIVPWPFEYPEVVKRKHEVFTILFYIPDRKDKEYTSWIYGEKYYNELVSNVDDVRWKLIKGSDDMSEIYKEIDLYIKINVTEYNDINMIGKECNHLGIDVLVLDTYKGFNLKETVRWINTKLDISPIKGEKVCSCKK